MRFKGIACGVFSQKRPCQLGNRNCLLQSRHWLWGTRSDKGLAIEGKANTFGTRGNAFGLEGAKMSWPLGKKAWPWPKRHCLWRNKLCFSLKRHCLLLNRQHLPIPMYAFPYHMFDPWIASEKKALLLSKKGIACREIGNTYRFQCMPSHTTCLTHGYERQCLLFCKT